MKNWFRRLWAKFILWSQGYCYKHTCYKGEFSGKCLSCHEEKQFWASQVARDKRQVRLAKIDKAIAILKETHGN